MLMLIAWLFVVAVFLVKPVKAKKTLAIIIIVLASALIISRIVCMILLANYGLRIRHTLNFLLFGRKSGPYNTIFKNFVYTTHKVFSVNQDAWIEETGLNLSRINITYIFDMIIFIAQIFISVIAINPKAIIDKIKTVKIKIAENKTEENNMSDETNTQSSGIPEEYKPISMWGYFGYEILFSLPIIGQIILIIKALTASNKNVKNFARSYFCFLIIAAIVAIISFSAFAGGSSSRW